MFFVTVTDVADVALCRVEGDLDGMTVSRFRQTYARCLGRPALVIDLSDLLFVSSAARRRHSCAGPTPSTSRPSIRGCRPGRGSSASPRTLGRTCHRWWGAATPRYAATGKVQPRVELAAVYRRLLSSSATNDNDTT